MRLGRLEHDPARVAAVKPHIVGASPLPTQAIVWTPSLVRNDVLGTCSVAGLINSARYHALVHGFDLVNDEQLELDFFARLAGVSPTDEAALIAVPGLQLMDVLETAQRTGFNVGGQAPLVPDFSAIEIQDEAAIQDAIATTGCAYVGVRLYAADMQPDSPWTGGVAGAGAFVGGHCILLTSADAATWGYFKQPDPEWIMSRIDEAYAIDWTFAV